MLLPRLLTALFLILMAILGIGPFPTTSLIAVYIVLFRPRWFKTLIDKIYLN
jgi:hypothetical protein